MITTKNLKGNGNLDASGGVGSDGGGGGGGGGRITINLLKSYIFNNQPEQSGYWNGTFNIDGGFGGRNREIDGSKGMMGTAIGSKC